MLGFELIDFATAVVGSAILDQDNRGVEPGQQLLEKLDIAGTVEPTAAFGRLLQPGLITASALRTEHLIQGLMKALLSRVTQALQRG